MEELFLALLVFELHGNEQTTVPEQIGDLKQLRELNFSENKLE